MSKPHQWETLKRIAWPVCSSCGLVRLKNAATRQAAKAPCTRGDKLEREGERLVKLYKAFQR